MPRFASVRFAVCCAGAVSKDTYMFLTDACTVVVGDSTVATLSRENERTDTAEEWWHSQTPEVCVYNQEPSGAASLFHALN